jgi:hypothetical protein
MNIELELREILDKVLVDSMEVKNLDALKTTWREIKNEGKLESFKDFVFGHINGILLNAYSTYQGKQVSELSTEERRDLDQLLFQRLYGLKCELDKYDSSNKTL